MKKSAPSHCDLVMYERTLHLSDKQASTPGSSAVNIKVRFMASFKDHERLAV